MRAQLRRRFRRAREGDEVLTAEMVEQIAEAAADELQRALRQQPRLDDPPHQALREIGRRRCGLHDDRHAGEDRRGELFQHPPHRKIERVDVYRRALARNVDVLPHEGARLRQRLDAAVEIDLAVRELARSLAREREHGADPAVDVDPRVVLGRAGPVGQLVELRFEIEEPFGERLEERRAFVKRQQAKRGAAAASCVRQDLAEVDAAGGGLGDQLPGRCIAQCGARAVGRVPASRDIAFEFHEPPASRRSCQDWNVPPEAASSQSSGAGVQYRGPSVRSKPRMPSSTAAAPKVSA